MSEDAREIDLLEALGEGVEELLAALEATEEDSAYLEGQAAYFQAVLEAIPEADPDERPQAVLERVAAEHGVEMEEAGIAQAPLDEERSGVLGAWGICIGYVEGFHAGAQRVIAEVEHAPPSAGPPGEGSQAGEH
jgi:hypothetical protein